MSKKMEEIDVKRVIDIFDKINEWTGKGFSWTLGALLVLMVYEVISRRFFNSPTVWGIELSVQLFACNFMIAAGFTLLRGSHVKIDIIYSKFDQRTRAILDVISYIIFFFPFTVLVLYQGIDYAYKSWQIYERSWSACRIPIYPIKTVIPITGFLILLQGISIFIRQLYIAIKGVENGRP